MREMASQEEGTDGEVGEEGGRGKSLERKMKMMEETKDEKSMEVN